MRESNIFSNITFIFSSIIFIVSILLSFKAYAIIDDKGRESIQFLYDYSTQERQYLEAIDKNEINNIINSKIEYSLSYSNDETGTIIEYEFKNALFHNYVYSECRPYIYNEVNTYYWTIFGGMVPVMFYEGNSGDKYPEWESPMLPTGYLCVELKDGFTANDIQISLLNTDFIEIFGIKLIPFFADQFDKPRKITENISGNTYIQNTFNDNYIPNDIFNIEQYSSYIRINFLLGQYNTENGNLKAFTKLKFHISNVRYEPYSNNLEVIIQDSSDSQILQTEYYTLQGIKVENPTTGNLYIKRTNNSSQKILY